jgi:hypothetical protein
MSAGAAAWFQETTGVTSGASPTAAAEDAVAQNPQQSCQVWSASGTTGPVEPAPWQMTPVSDEIGLRGRDPREEGLQRDQPRRDHDDRAAEHVCGKSGWHGNLSRGSLARLI